MSAGSIKLANNVVVPRDVDDNIPELAIYEGIGLVDINIEPHLNLTDLEHQKEIYEAAHHTTIYGIYDNTFISVISEKIKIYGPYIKYDKQ